MAGETTATVLAEMARRIEDFDRRLDGLAAEMRRRTGDLSEDEADTLVDRMDEMMDLLYLVDEHLTALLARETEES